MNTAILFLALLVGIVFGALGMLALLVAATHRDPPREMPAGWLTESPHALSLLP